MQIEIVTIGNEVLSGRTLDTNFAFLARALEEASVQVSWHTTVSDSAERIAEGLTRALERADAVIMTGGLGPTPDDLTRSAVAAVLDRPLQLDEAVLVAIRARIRRLGRVLPASVEAQALIPRGAEVWPNHHGTAPGLLIDQRGRPVILLPGVPSEMEALAREYAVPYLRERSGRVVESFTLRTYGVVESLLHERIGALPERWPAATLAYLPSWHGVDLRVTAAGTDAAAVRESAARARADLLARVGRVVYAEGTRGLEEVVGALLVERRWRIAVAESCTGGLLSKRLTDTPGSSRYLERGFVVYSNESKLELLGVELETLRAHGAVSAPVAEQMAVGAATRAGVEVGVSVTGIAGPEGGTEAKPVGTVFIAVAAPAAAAVAESSHATTERHVFARAAPAACALRQLRFTGSRAAIRERSAQSALDLVRRHLQGLPAEPTLQT